MTNGSLMKVMLLLGHLTLLLTFIKRYLVLKTNFCLFESGCFTQVSLYKLTASTVCRGILCQYILFFKDALLVWGNKKNAENYRQFFFLL